MTTMAIVTTFKGNMSPKPAGCQTGSLTFNRLKSEF